MTSQRRPALLIVIFALVAGVMFLGLRSCYTAVKGEKETVSATSAGDSIIAFKDGTTMIAERGTLGRAMVDWLELNKKGQATFLLAGEPFAQGSAELAPDTATRISRLAALLKANGEVTAQIFIFAVDSGNRQADLNLASIRARRVQTELVANKVAPSRFTVEGRPAPETVKSGSAVQSGRIAVTLSRNPES
jgi:outer membrane protein OmpA-like peptidoglycan-associated protein